MAADKIVLKKYPGFKIGRRRGLHEPVAAWRGEREEGLRFRGGRCFSWMELRDLTADVLSRAGQGPGGVRQTAWSRGWICHGRRPPGSTTFWEVFSARWPMRQYSRGPARSVPRVPVRTLRRSKKTHWTFDELREGSRRPTRPPTWRSRSGCSTSSRTPRSDQGGWCIDVRRGRTVRRYSIATLAFIRYRKFLLVESPGNGQNPKRLRHSSRSTSVEWGICT